MSMMEKYEAQLIENKWKNHWLDKETYSWKQAKSDQGVFSVDTPPPTVSGSLHLGHIFSYTQTDLIVRFQRMLGKKIFYPMGWDDNGLPTERRVQNVFGIRCDLNQAYNPEWKPNRNKGKDDPIENVSRRNFIEACSILTLEDEEVFKNLFKRLGLSVDWSLEYATINPHCRKVSQMSFLDLAKKNQAYGLESPTLWDVTFQTAVAQAEVEDREVNGFYHDLRFQVKGSDQSFVIATTRPELLPACIAVVAHPDDERFRPLFGKTAVTPLFGVEVPILAAEHADPAKGSGILMVCTFGDTMDIEWWKQSGLPLKQILGFNGCLLPLEWGKAPFLTTDRERAQQHYNSLVGLSADKARKKIVEILRESGDLVSEPKPTVRPVKFYEKGDRPLEFISTRQWFVKILQHKEKLQEYGEKIQWQPSFMLSRYQDWVKGLNQDWCISRQRYFGVPFPVWYPLNEEGYPLYDRPIFADERQLPVDPMSDVPAGYSESQRNQPNGFIGEKDVMDTWATSSLTPQIVAHWPESQLYKEIFPMSLRPQSHEIIRTWAFYTIVKAYLHDKQIPWEQIAISGWILDPDRKKMSKSKGNVVTPEKFLEDYGADAVRYWAARARLGVDTAFDENLFKMGRKLCNKLFNAGRFVLGQIEESGLKKEAFQFNFQAMETYELIDQAWIKRMENLIERATQAFEKNDYASALQMTEDTFWKFCDHYLELVKVRSYAKEEKDLAGKLSAIRSLNFSFRTFLLLFAPFFPFLTDEVWHWFYAEQEGQSEKSIHQHSWPSLDQLKNHLRGEKKEISVEENLIDLAVEILSSVRAEKTKNQKKLRWPVDQLEIVVQAALVDKVKKMLPDIILTGNVKTAGVTLRAATTSEEMEKLKGDMLALVHVQLAEYDEAQSL